MQLKYAAIMVSFLHTFSVGAHNQAVTYELSPGRFADNLLSYIHAKYISYKYDLPLLYKPFIYSDQLVLHEVEQRYKGQLQQQFAVTRVLGQKVSVDPHDTASILYIAPYFPESKWELSSCKNFSGGSWDYFIIDWGDTAFIETLRKVIAPQNPSMPLTLPADRISLAVHVRRGGSHDTPDVPRAFPLKFLPDEFFITHIKKVYELLHERPLYVHFFTDDPQPTLLMHKAQQALQGLDIQWGCRRDGNTDTMHVVEDFFTLQQFDCLIHSESNFSFVMSKLGDYLISLYPDSFHREGTQIIYDHINVSLDEKRLSQIKK